MSRVVFLTGTDEHGQKVLEAAEAHGVTPQAWTDRLVETEWEPVLHVVDVSNDQFIRTTEPRHTERVQEFWQAIHDAGDVYEGTYEGPYCDRLRGVQAAGRAARRRGRRQALPDPRHAGRDAVGDQLLLRVEQVRRPAARPVCRRADASCSRRARATRSSRSSSRVCRTCRSAARRSTGASRSRGTRSTCFYVWIDALLNYVTAAGLDGTDPERFARTWPADVHLVGKDILRFHAVIWPAMLMAAGVDVPQTGVRARLARRSAARR